jgi:ribose-phosphate pyrophosphokinase
MIDCKDFGGRDILVVDDLSVFGGTFLGLASMLRERNVGKLFLAVSHITVQNPNKALETAFDRIYCTNSKFDKYDLSNLTVFNLDDLKIFE